MPIRDIFLMGLAIPISAWLMYGIVVISRGPSLRCPKCGAKRIRRTSRRWADKLLPAFIAPRRCEVCKKRFHHLKSVNYPGGRPAVRTSSRARGPEPAHTA
jgi:hypothetical protein